MRTLGGTNYPPSRPGSRRNANNPFAITESAELYQARAVCLQTVKVVNQPLDHYRLGVMTRDKKETFSDAVDHLLKAGTLIAQVPQSHW